METHYDNIEYNPRYKELLDEEAAKLGYVKNVTAPELHWRYVIKQDNIRVSAQRRYFIELLQEKDEKLNKAASELLDNYKSTLVAQNQNLIATLTERDKEIDRLKNELIETHKKYQKDHKINGTT